MGANDDHLYYARRARESLHAAARARDASAQLIHQTLARAYQRLADKSAPLSFEILSTRRGKPQAPDRAARAGLVSAGPAATRAAGPRRTRS